MAVPRAAPSLMFRHSISGRSDRHPDLATASGFRRNRWCEPFGAAVSRAGAPSCSPPSASWPGDSTVGARGFLCRCGSGTDALQGSLSWRRECRPSETCAPASNTLPDSADLGQRHLSVTGSIVHGPSAYFAPPGSANSVLSSSCNRKSACSTPKVSGGRILRTSPLRPVTPSRTPRSRMAFATRRV